MLGVWAILVSLGSVGPAGAAERVAGYVVTVDRYGYILASGESQWIPLEVRRRVSYGDRLMTIADSRVQLYLWGDVVFILGPDSQAELSAPRRGVRERVLRLSLGSFRLLALAGAPEARLLVVTPTAVTAVRGTEVMGEADKEHTSIAVVRGEVEVQGTAKGGTVLLRAGQGTDIAAGQDPTEAVVWPKERLERLRAATAVKLFW